MLIISNLRRTSPSKAFNKLFNQKKLSKSHGRERSTAPDAFFPAPTCREHVFSRAKVGHCTASASGPHVYPHRLHEPANRGKLCNSHVTERFGQSGATHGQRKHRRTWLGCRVHVRRADCSAARASSLGNRNVSPAPLTYINITVH